MPISPKVPPPPDLPLPLGGAGAPRDAPAKAGRTPRLPVLDGVRGLAILLVMAHHFLCMNPATRLDHVVSGLAHYGTVGVDLFFVLSGFLITGILYDAKGHPHYFRNFYARRALRIVPAYYATLVVFLVILPRLAPGQFGRPAEAPVWYWTFLANFPMGDLPAFSHVLNVAWSVCVEEQFYLAWPLVTLLLGRRPLMATCGAMMLVAIGARLGLALLDAGDHIREYTWTMCRLDGLAVGAWIALALRDPAKMAPRDPAGLELPMPTGAATPPSRRLVRWAVVAIAGSALSLVALEFWERYDEASRFTGVGFFTAVAVGMGGFLVLCLAASPAGRLARAVGCAPLRMLGKYSYALYLCHLPIAVVLRDRVFGPARFPTVGGSPLPGQLVFYALALSASLAVSWLSWHLFERRFLALKRHFPSGA